MKTILALVLLSAMVAQAETNRVAITPKYINALAEEARVNHPAMLAAEARVRAASQNERAVKLWDDPEVMFGGMLGKGVMRPEEGDLLYGVEQRLPINGKPQAERAMARAESGVEDADRTLRFQTLRRDIAEAVFRLALAEETVRIHRQDHLWLETLSVATMERYKAGKATQVETLRSETEHFAKEEALRVVEKERESAAIILNRLLNRPLESAWPEMALPELAPPLASSELLLSLATKFEPKLRMMRQEIARAQAGAAVAKRARRPDFSLGADARQFAGDGQFKEGSVYVKMSIPWINKSKYDAAFRREQDRAEAVTWEAGAYEAEVRDEISRLVIRIDNARRQAILYREQIIPRSEQALAAAESSWQSGRSFFLEVLEARRVLLNGRLMFARAVAEQHQALAQTVLCCGLGDLEAVELFQNSKGTEK
jgi:cobalt-zinc-cadmium efflux system outer membrane protein